jgi:hypothetical protein
VLTLGGWCGRRGGGAHLASGWPAVEEARIRRDRTSGRLAVDLHEGRAEERPGVKDVERRGGRVAARRGGRPSSRRGASAAVRPPVDLHDGRAEERPGVGLAGQRGRRPTRRPSRRSSWRPAVEVARSGGGRASGWAGVGLRRASV